MYKRQYEKVKEHERNQRPKKHESRAKRSVDNGREPPSKDQKPLNLYAILGIPSSTTQTEIQKAARKKASKLILMNSMIKIFPPKRSAKLSKSRSLMIRPRTSSATLLQDSSMDEFKKWRQKQRMADERERTLQGVRAIKVRRRNRHRRPGLTNQQKIS